uniref:Uncharacterized protein n=1 Tax=Arundo donax TaxID=35708 RepID=A0A0A8Z1X6_ARUDO
MDTPPVRCRTRHR